MEPPEYGANALSELIKAIMKEQGISAADVAERSGLGISTIYTYLDGRARGDRPRSGTIEKLARGLGVDPSDLYAVADRADARGEQRLLRHFRQIRTEAGRAEAIEAVRRISLRGDPTEPSG